MAETASKMLPLGTIAPDFHLVDSSSGKTLSLNELKAKTATVVMFICNHCPYVKLIQPKLIEIARDYKAKGVSFIAINSNDIKNYPDDNPEKMRALALEKNFPFPYLFDESQAVAKAYQATCTPDFFVFDANLSCVYRGRFDEATPGNGKTVTGKDLATALDQLLAGELISSDQKPSVGCNIKWKK